MFSSVDIIQLAQYFQRL